MFEILPTRNDSIAWIDEESRVIIFSHLVGATSESVEVVRSLNYKVIRNASYVLAMTQQRHSTFDEDKLYGFRSLKDRGSSFHETSAFAFLKECFPSLSRGNRRAAVFLDDEDAVKFRLMYG